MDNKIELINKINHFSSKNGLNIKELNGITVETLVTKGYIKEFSDIYKLKNYENELIQLDIFKNKKIEDLFNAIEKSRDTDFVSFICSMDIEGIDKKQAEILKDYLADSYDAFEEEMYNEYSGEDDHFNLLRIMYQLYNEEYDFNDIDGFYNGDSLVEWCDDYLNPYYCDGSMGRLIKELNFTDKPITKECTLDTDKDYC